MNNSIWYRFYSEKDSYEINFNTNEMSIADIKKKIIDRRNMHKFPENFDLIFYDEEDFKKIDDKDLVKPMKHLIIKRFPCYRLEKYFKKIVKDPQDISMNKINENGLKRVEPEQIVRYTEPLEKIMKKLNREMINKQFKCKICQKDDEETLLNPVIFLCCKETFCLNCYNKNENTCPNQNCRNNKQGYIKNEAESDLVKKLLNILEKKEEQEKIQRAAAVIDVFGNNQRNVIDKDIQNTDSSNIKFNLAGNNVNSVRTKIEPNLYQLPNMNPCSSLIIGSQFFIIKSSNKENVEISKKYSLWATTIPNTKKLNDAFNKGEGNVILIFSASGTQSYQGYAIMTSNSSDTSSGLWKIENIKLGGDFSVTWLCFCELSFSKVKHLQNPKKNGDPINKSRDCTELSQNIGYELCNLCFEQEKNELINNQQQPKVQINEHFIEKILEEIKNNKNKQLKKINKSINNNGQNENLINNNSNKPNENQTNQNPNNLIQNPIQQNHNHILTVNPMFFPNPFYFGVFPNQNNLNPLYQQSLLSQQLKQENEDKNKKDKDKNRDKDKRKNRERDKDRKSKREHKKDHHRRDRDRDRGRRDRSRDKDSRSGSKRRIKSKSSRPSSSDSSRSEGKSKYSKSYK